MPMVGRSVFTAASSCQRTLVLAALCYGTPPVVIDRLSLDSSKRSHERRIRCQRGAAEALASTAAATLDFAALAAAKPEKLLSKRDRHLRDATEIDPQEALGETLLPLLRVDDLVAAGCDLERKVALDLVDFPRLEAPEDRLERLELRALDVCVGVARP